ncbi:hypothetical protein Nepgr_016975 [Nepenthes gracilis]|uniref:Uncharacterized protein n=1 Tax=Nepenthes gracilis TaxID=150966 RepID=A0AAD3XSN0_NEPGR|nr:hypothetical protein Nepgr_016975 [Nepenthes gracilis]
MYLSIAIAASLTSNFLITTTMQVPRKNNPITERASPYMWDIGKAAKKTFSLLISLLYWEASNLTNSSTIAMKFRWVSITRLLLPVVPAEFSLAAMSSWAIQGVDIDLGLCEIS